MPLVSNSWPIIQLGDAASFVNGYAFKPKDWESEGLEIIRIQNLTKGGSTTNYFNGEIKEKYKVVKGDFLISWSATLGIYTWERDDAWLNQHIFKVVFDKKEFDKSFFKHLISMSLESMGRETHGSTMKHITKPRFDSFKIPYPPLKEQKKIAEILDAADSLRQKDQQLVEHYDRLSQSLFLDMFGDSVANPKDWEVNKLKDLSVKIHSGNTPKGGSKVYVNQGVAFFRSQNVWKNRLELDDVVYIDEAIHSNMSKSSLKNKDILMTKTGRINTENSSLGRAAMFLGEDDTANVNGHVYLIRLREGVINEFVLFILTSIEYRGYIRSVCVGGIDKRQLNKDHIENFPIISPPRDLQEKFVDQLKLIEKQKKLAEQSLKKSGDLFNSLLQKAFKGELTAS